MQKNRPSGEKCDGRLLFGDGESGGLELAQTLSPRADFGAGFLQDPRGRDPAAARAAGEVEDLPFRNSSGRVPGERVALRLRPEPAERQGFRAGQMALVPFGLLADAPEDRFLH